MSRYEAYTATRNDHSPQTQRGCPLKTQQVTMPGISPLSPDTESLLRTERPRGDGGLKGNSIIASWAWDEGMQIPG
jgi:hypothetical protein